MARKKSSSPKTTTAKTKKARAQAPPPRKLPREKKVHAEESLFPVVGVGGSAGGLEAFSALLRALPANTGMAFVYIQHVDPTHESLLGDLLGRTTRMPVTTVKATTSLEINHVYVIAPNTQITIADNHLKVHARRDANPFRPIDRFFASLAERRKSGAIAVILSGTATDGVRGLREIKTQGGFTFAQDPKSSKFESMPRHAIGTGCVDLVLPPEQIAKELATLRKHPYVDGMAREDAAGNLVHEDGLKQLFSLLRRASGIDFAGYKPATLKRRIARRMALLRSETLDEFIEKLRKDPKEQLALQEDMLICVTSFFREPEVGEALCGKVFPRLLESVSGGSLRFWVAGCATGQEVFSLAMNLCEYLSERHVEMDVQIFGTDVSHSAIEFARTGSYPESIANEVSTGRLRRFFKRVEDGYQVNQTIREMCVFARHDVTRDPPFSKIDLVSCRNLLIYLGSESQKRLAAMFHYALNPSGYLVLGKSESFGMQTLFAVEDSKNKIFRPKPVATPRLIDFAAPDPAASPAEAEATPAKKRVAAQIQADAENFIWEHYGAAGMIVDTDLQVHHIRGDISPYIAMAQGEASLHLPKLLRPELALKARSLIQKAKKTSKPARQENLQIKKDGGYQLIHMRVIPRSRRDGLQTFIVFFENAGRARKGKKELTQPLAGPAREVSELEKELASTQQYLQSVIEDQEASNEELRAANEEVRSANEELQSTNEEMETAKEELQSSNEELITLNEELRERNNELRIVTDDLENLLLGIDMPVVIIGGDHRIRRFTPSAEKLLNLLPSDVGRPIENVKGEIEIPGLKDLIDGVVERVEHVEREVHDGNGHWYVVQMRPFKTAQNKVDGLLLALVNIDREKAADQKREISEGALKVNRQWSTGLLSLQEDERRRLARELHDNINQRMAAVTMQVEMLQADVEGSEKQKVQAIHRRLRDVMEQIRLLSHRLHPSTLEMLGLGASIETLGEEYRAANVSVHCKQSKVPGDLPSDIALNLFRVAQEAVKNAVDHAEASKITVRLDGLSKGMRLTIEDDGKGFNSQEDVSKGGLGLLSMRERMRILGGTLTVKTGHGRGTKIEANVPL